MSEEQLKNAQAQAYRANDAQYQSQFAARDPERVREEEMEITELDKLDRLCAEKIMEFPEAMKYGERNYLIAEGTVPENYIQWQPTLRIEQAWELLEKFERYTVMTYLKNIPNQIYLAVVGVEGIGEPWRDCAATAPLAIVRACLKAKGLM